MASNVHAALFDVIHESVVATCATWDLHDEDGRISSDGLKDLADDITRNVLHELAEGLSG